MCVYIYEFRARAEETPSYTAIPQKEAREENRPFRHTPRYFDFASVAASPHNREAVVVAA